MSKLRGFVPRQAAWRDNTAVRQPSLKCGVWGREGRVALEWMGWRLVVLTAFDRVPHSHPYLHSSAVLVAIALR